MSKIRQADLGTPASRSTETVRIEIDGLPATVKAGTFSFIGNTLIFRALFTISECPPQ